MVVITEGGYDLHALAASLDVVLDAISGPAAAPAWPSGDIASIRGLATIDRVRPFLSRFWTV